MKKFLFISMVLACFSPVFAQRLDSTTNFSSKELNDTTIYTDVDTPASFPGGQPAWFRYIEKRLNPSVGVDNGARTGTYNVRIKFTVTKDGVLKDFVPVTKYRHGFEGEVIRVLKLSPGWIPAKKNGVNVNSIAEQLLVFMVSKG
jgi:protein TonB